ncbi:hypothetical protein BD626DRAFT_572318 [Schizophyllum amplum]|uniref:Uncharacterized protein n=1 Tax=Schizophyllum amplum TaxID=97359 RepID=A0A550C532_9AGAR|nr:hypothetical protein BD626DRAFT_572318 [Auriculariopsis ampla]
MPATALSMTGVFAAPSTAPLPHPPASATPCPADEACGSTTCNCSDLPNDCKCGSA